MIETGIVSKVKVQDVISNQLPEFIRDESPLTDEFLKQYYISQEYQGAPIDLAGNLDQYLNINNLLPEVIVDTSTTVGLTTTGDETIKVSSTKGFPNQYGLLKINNEIITYTGITTNSFTGCERGFSGITSYHSDLNQEDLVFSSSVSDNHDSGSTIQNLSSLFLKEFYKKFKKTFLPGLESTDFQSKLDVGTFIGNSRSLYQTKGTDESFRILFNILYGLTPKVLNLEERLVKPSSANYVRRRVCVAELLSGNPIQLQGQSLLKGLTGQTLFRSDLDSDKNASISEIEPFERKNSGITGITTYYKIGLFVGYDESADVENDFVIVPNTKSLEKVSIGSSIINVDSTIGFGTTGTIISGLNTITYNGKTVNQFLNCTGIGDTIFPIQNIRSNITYFGFENGDLDKKVTLRLTGVISDFEQEGKIDVNEGELISIRGLGDRVENNNETYKETFCNSWVYNTRSSFFIDSISGSTYTLLTDIDKSSLKKGDLVEIVDKRNNEIVVPFDNNIPPHVEDFGTVGVGQSTVTLSSTESTLSKLIEKGIISNASEIVNFKIRKVLNKAHSDGAPIEYGNDAIISDILNVYTDKNSETAYITSNSLPSFIDNENADISKKININTKNISVDLSQGGSISGDSGQGINYSTINFGSAVPFDTGDKIFYSHSDGDGLIGIETGSYFIKKVGPKSIRLFTSPSNIDGGRNLTFTKNSTNGIVSFVLFSQKSSIIGAQKLLKEFPLNQNISNGKDELTDVGQTGILINGVEISNYKSSDKIYYGPLENLQVLNNGEDYDVINLPNIVISTGIGTTALAQPVISGKVKNVSVDPQNFDVTEVISIGVTGGNGSGCVLEPVVGERFRIELFNTNTKTSSESRSGINTSDERIVFYNDHNFQTGDPIIYDSFNNLGVGTGVAGSLVPDSIYYPYVENSKTITLHKTAKDALTGGGINKINFNGNNVSGNHAFKVGLRKTLLDVKVINEGDGYTNRNLKINPTGISTQNDSVNFVNHGFQDGEVIEYFGNISGLTQGNSYYILKIDDNSFNLSDAGIGATISSNYIRRKQVNLTSNGVGIQTFKYPDIEVFVDFTGTTPNPPSFTVVPTVRGSIDQLYLYESGTGYGSTILNNHKKPIITLENGVNASVIPNIIDGKIDSVRVVGGKQYYSVPDLVVTDPTGLGVGAELRAVLGVNPISSEPQISDVIIINSGIGYSTDTTVSVKSAGRNAFFDANVRSLTINKHNVNDDYQLLEDSENKLKYSVTGYDTSLLGSSNLIGWAYDGNPIYGPFGSDDPTERNDLTKKLQSGYKKTSDIVDRPPVDSNIEFIEDYVFDNSGDLDKHNGRYEVTSDFPNGVYAYHATLGDNNIPKFPYFIGNSYRSKVIENNISSVNQNNFDFNNSGVLRNTFPYKIGEKSADNDFIVETNEIENQKLQIESIISSSVTGFDIVNGGVNYKVDETLDFDEEGTSGSGLISVISKIDGKLISKIETTLERKENTVITWGDSKLNFFTEDNHNYNNNDLVVISGLSTDISQLNDTFKINVDKFETTTISTVTASSNAGVTTDIYVAEIPTSVSVGSSITISDGTQSETLKILNIYSNNILTVQRDFGSSYSLVHPKGSNVSYLPNKFTINKTIDRFESVNNRKIFFNAEESIGVSTADGSEISKTFNFAGNNVTRNIPVKQIYLENHRLETNQKVKLTQPSNTNVKISIDNGTNYFNIPETLFVVNKTINTIGIKTQINGVEVHFLDSLNSFCDDDTFFFETQFDEVTCKVENIKTELTTSTAHELETGDKISLAIQPNLSVGIGTSTHVRVFRDELSGNVLINKLNFTNVGVNTITNSFNIENHHLNTGEKVKYNADILPEGLENKNYFVYRVDDDNIKLCDTFIDSQKNTPSIVGFGTTGGLTQSVALVNPSFNVINNNDLKFDLSDSSVNGYTFNLYTDDKFINKFVNASGISTVFNVVSLGSTLTVGYTTSLPDILYYNLEKSGTISTVDSSVQNYSKIEYIDSNYNGDYSITKVGIKTFSIFLEKNPEKLSYLPSECDVLKYSTTSKTTTGSINSINILSGGTGYKKLPKFIGVGSSSLGVGAVIKTKSSDIGNIDKIRVLNEGFEYSSDNTLRPESLIASSVDIINSATIGIVTVVNGGSNFIEAPNVIIVNTDTGLQIESGFLEPVMLENSILSVNVVESPVGLPANPVTIRTTNNTNGITIDRVLSNNSGIFTCRIATPNAQFSTPPFAEGDRVFIEGIEKISSDGSGFNSSDYGFNLLKVTDFSYVNSKGQVTIDLSEFGGEVKTGLSESSDLQKFANIINESDYPEFGIILEQTTFKKGEFISVNDKKTNLEIVDIDTGKLKIFGALDLNVGDIIKGEITGSEAEISNISENKLRLKTDFSILKDLGWNDSIGKLNEDFQVVPDNDYYQNMSYSIQSSIEWDTFKSSVNNLVHTSGMKNFADLGISSSAKSGVGTELSENKLVLIRDIIEEKRVDEIKNIDTVRDTDIIGNTARKITFDNIRLSDFISCKTNDVLTMDDLSPSFSNLEEGVDSFIDLIEFNETAGVQFFNNLLVVTTSNPADRIEISDLMVISNGSENILVKKGNLINSDDGFNTADDIIVDYKLHNNLNTGRNTLRFSPVIDPIPGNESDYDLKIFKTEFNTNLVGVGTSSIGPINLSSRNKISLTGITTDIITVPISSFDSLYATVFVYDIFSNKMNLIESFVTHNDSDSFLTQSYFSGENKNISLESLGIITSSVSSGNLILSFDNQYSNSLNLKSKVVVFGDTGTANDEYRFKTEGQEDGSERTSFYAGMSTSNVGVSTLQYLDSNLINAVKTVAEVSIGSSKAVHEALFIHDGTNAYAHQAGSLSVTKDYNSEYDPSVGLGTFGASLSGSSFKIEFYPDKTTGISTVVALNHCFYTLVDEENIPEDLTYGTITESNSIKFYNSVTGNRAFRTKFTPKVNSIPLYGKRFNPNSSSDLNLSTGLFTLENHFFRNNEELIYTPKSTFVGVGSTAMQYKGVSGGIGSLTSPVFAIVNDENSFSISTTKSGTAVTFTSVGEGNAHQFDMLKANEKSLIILDDVVQYPLIRTDVTHTLDSNLNAEVGIATDIIHLSGITTIASSDILKIEDEFVEVINVGLGTTGGAAVSGLGTFNTIQVNRSFVGSSATTHADGTTVTRFKGSYHINGRDLFFTKAPRGNVNNPRTINDLPSPVSKFSGRVYLRNNYDTNLVFDDISDQFTGIKSDFVLKVGGANTVGLGTTGGSGILFINGIFQSPSTEFNPNKNFKIVESGTGASGVTTVIFTGITSENGNPFISNNINTNELPRGGVPISIGNTVNGLGYAPLKGARVKPIIGAGGTIASIVGVAYSASDLVINNAEYDNTTGVMKITTDNEHPFYRGGSDFVLLNNITFNPPITFIRTNSIEVVSIAATNIFSVSIGKSTVDSHTYVSGGNAYPFYPDLTFGSGYNDIVSIGVTVQDPGYKHRFISANDNALTIFGGGGSLTPTDADYDPVTGVLKLSVANHNLTNSSKITIVDSSLFFSCSKDNFRTVHPYPRTTDPVSGIATDVTVLSDDLFSVNVYKNVGSGAVVSATAGVGGTAIFNIVDGGENYKDPQIFVSQPSYSNLSVKGISRVGEGPTTETGTDLRVTAIVKPVTGIGSTLFEVSEYEVVNSGFGFKKGDVVEPVGLVTSKELSQLDERSRITIDKVYNDSFALWQFGDFDYIDSIKNLQNGSRTAFPLKVTNQLVSVELDKNTTNKNFRIEDVFLVIVNGVIQEPVDAYTIIGGNTISFSEPPLGSTSSLSDDADDISILFYKGTAGEDSIGNFAESLTIEVGDTIQLQSGSGVEKQDQRTVFNLNTSQTLETNPYRGVGINSDKSRPLNLIKQKEDKVINQLVVSKKRESIEPRISPTAKIISDVTLANTGFFVDNADLFNYEPSTSSLNLQIIDPVKDTFANAKATATISAGGTVTGFNISNFGFGYTTNPTVEISAPPTILKQEDNTIVGVGTTATATATINASGAITKIEVVNPGLGYTIAPQVLISSPFNLPERTENLSTDVGISIVVKNNCGVVTGIGTTLFGSPSQLALEFTLKRDDFDNFDTESPIDVGTPIYIFDTQVGSGLTSINLSKNDSDVVGIGTSFIDNVYMVAAKCKLDGNVGLITSYIKSDSTITGLDLAGSTAIGKYSVGLITSFTRGENPISIGVTGLSVGLSTALGISTFPTLKRSGGPRTLEQSGGLSPS